MRRRARIEVSEPACTDGKWYCTGKILGGKYDHLPWLGEGAPPDDDPDDDPPTVTLFLVAGVGATADEARANVLSKIRHVWGSHSTPPPEARIEEVTEQPRAVPSVRDDSLVSRLFRFLRRKAS